MKKTEIGRPTAPEKNLSPLVEALKAERLRQNITQTYIAEKIGVNNQDYLSRIENGRFICRYEYLERYAEALGFRLGLVKQTPKENRLEYLAEHFTAEELRTACNIKGDIEDEGKEVTE